MAPTKMLAQFGVIFTFVAAPPAHAHAQPQAHDHDQAHTQDHAHAASDAPAQSGLNL